MIHFKNKPGFTLIEAMIAIVIISMIVAPMFLLETNVFNAVVTTGERFYRFTSAKNFLYVAQQQEPLSSTNYSIEKKEDHPLSMVRYTLTSNLKESSLASIKRLYKQEVIASGMQTLSPQGRLIHFVYKPEPVES